jgi:hypothetical protein
MPFRHFQSSTANIAPASAPAMLCEGAATTARSEFIEPNSHAPVRPPNASAMK